MQDLENKEFLIDMTDNQKGQVVSEVEAGKVEDAKKPKKSKAPEKTK